MVVICVVTDRMSNNKPQTIGVTYIVSPESRDDHVKITFIQTFTSGIDETSKETGL